MAPLIQRRPSRVIVDVSRGPTAPATPSAPTPPAMRRQNSAAPPPEELPKPGIVAGSSGGGRQVLLRVRVSAGADVNFTTTISV